MKKLLTIAGLLVAIAMLLGCGSVDMGYVMKSHNAALTAAQPYFGDHCEQLAAGPLFTVDWGERVTYGGGVVVGCTAQGKLLLMECHEAKEKGKPFYCAPLRLYFAVETPDSGDVQ